MTIKAKKIVAIVFAIIAVVSVMMLFVPKGNYSLNVHADIEVNNGTVEKDCYKTIIKIKKTGKYVINADWWMDEAPGFITGLIVNDESGNSVFSVTGGMLKCDSSPLELKEGKYTVNLNILPSADAYLTYAKENFENGEIGEADKEMFKNGVWSMDYKININEYIPFAKALFLCFGVVVGLLIVALIVVSLRKENAPAVNYDERQIAEQGKSYKYGFFAMLIYYVLVLMVFAGGIKLPITNDILIFTGLLVGGAFMATNSILKDAYFRLDENKNGMILFFVLLTVLNLTIGVLNIINGRAMTNGQATLTGSANLFCGVFLLYVLGLILAKRIMDGKED
ncbi:MAG: hypothetical protein K5858_07635 [Lachnospiraceae bacterium]|nr:hypothetical protein [Lachnospiraceae bacterium]